MVLGLLNCGWWHYCIAKQLLLWSNFIDLVAHVYGWVKLLIGGLLSRWRRLDSSVNSLTILRNTTKIFNLRYNTRGSPVEIFLRFKISVFFHLVLLFRTHQLFGLLLLRWIENSLSEAVIVFLFINNNTFIDLSISLLIFLLLLEFLKVVYSSWIFQSIHRLIVLTTCSVVVVWISIFIWSKALQ